MKGLRLLKLTKEEIVETAKKSALAGAFTDGIITAFKREGPVAILRDMGCGAVTGTAGSVSTLAFREYIKDSVPLSIMAGSGVSILSRYGYRSVFGPSLDDNEEET